MNQLRDHVKTCWQCKVFFVALGAVIGAVVLFALMWLEA